MIRTMKSLSLAAAAGALAIVFSVPAAAVEPTDAKKLEMIARDAKTPAQHANVARQYRLRAEALEAKAEQHEAEARKLMTSPRIGVEGKNPSMARNTWQRERSLAEQARRQSREAYKIADRHLFLTVEGQLAE
jgi:hypothetical protein